MTTLLFLMTAVAGLVPDGDLAPEIARWERAIVKLEDRDRSEIEIRDGVLFYGSSSIRLWKSIADDLAPWPIIQRGYGGAKLPDIIHYAPRIVGPHLGPENPRRCRAIVLFVANDITGRESDKSPDEVARLFAELHQWIRNQDVTIPIFWIEVTPTGSRWRAWPAIALATEKIATIIAQDENSYLIETAGAFLGPNGRPRAELFVADQLHLNSDGYMRWSVLIKAQLHAQLGPAIDPNEIESNELPESVPVESDVETIVP